MKQLLMIIALLIGVTAIVQADESALLETVTAGQTAQYSFEIRNDSNASHDYSLTLEGLSTDMPATFTQGGPILDSVTIDAQSYQPLILRIDVPMETTVGRYSADILAQRDDGTELRIPLTLTVENTYALRITSQNLNINTFSGQEFTIAVTASNTGAADVTNLSLAIDLPSKWIAHSVPLTIDHLAPEETANFTASVLVSPAQIAIDYPISIVLNSDQVSSPEASVMVRVQNNPNYLIYALALVGIVIAGVFLYFRRKGRR